MMPRFFFLFLLWTLLGPARSGRAQQAFRWQQAHGSAANEYGGQAVAVPGGYLLTGTQQRLGGLAADLLLVRTDARGNQLSTRTVPLAHIWRLDYAQVTPDAAGNLLAMGWGYDPSGTTTTDFVAKLTPTGDTLWVRRFVPLPGRVHDLRQLVLSPDGHCVVLANLNGAPSGARAYRLLKLDAASGATLWDRYLQPTLDASFPVFGYADAVQPVGNNLLVFVRGNVGGRGANGTLLLDATGQLLRQHIGGRPPFYSPSATLTDRNGDVLAASVQRLTKLTPQGDTLWHTVAPQAYQNRGWSAKALVQEADGGYTLLSESRYSQPLGGPTNMALHLVRFSAQGQVRTDTLLYRPGDTFAGSLLLTATGEFVLAGTLDNGPLGGSDLLLAQLRRAGPLSLRRPAALPVAEALTPYPNPVRGVAVRLPRPAALGRAPATLLITDALGRTVHTLPWPATTAELALPAGPPGLFLLRLLAPDGRTWSGKLLRE